MGAESRKRSLKDIQFQDFFQGKLLPLIGFIDLVGFTQFINSNRNKIVQDKYCYVLVLSQTDFPVGPNESVHALSQHPCYDQVNELYKHQQ